MRWLAALLLGAALASFAGTVGAGQARAAVSVTDIAGRTVTLASPPRRLLLADSFVITALNVLERDPVGVIAGWSSTFKTVDPASYASYAAQFPAIAAIPTIGEMGAGGASMEQIVALRPDLVVLPIELLPQTKLVERLEAFGLPVVYVDFFVDPGHNTVPSMRALGHLLGQDEKAERFIRFYQAHLRRLETGGGAKAGGPKVLLQAHAGVWKCCWSPGRASLGAAIALGGGVNIGAGPLPAQGGWLSREYVIAQDPAIYIATGRNQNGAQGGIAVGTGVSAAEARASLAAFVKTSDQTMLSAIRHGRVFGLWNFFLDTPANIVAAEVIARWIDPERFGDLAPEQTLAELNAMLAVAMHGTYWISLEKDDRGD